MRREYQICTRCVMDTTDQDIVFDEHGVCNHCTIALKKLKEFHFSDEIEQHKKFIEIVDEIKKEGKGKQHDCIIGLSGGVDSSYLAYIVKNTGLRPLAVHVDNGWNSELAVQNIENIVKKLNIDLYTHVIDWEEFKDLQKAFLKASVIDLEMLSDNAIVIGIYRIQKKYKIKYFIDGTNFQAESIMPANWYYARKMDSLNIKDIYKKFGNKQKLSSYPMLNLFEYFGYRFLNTAKHVSLLNYITYRKAYAIKILENELDWRDYGGKHYESKITQFYQAYILPTKFNVDKRKAHLSSLICSLQITREEALKELNIPLYSESQLKEDKEYFLKKLYLSEKEFDSILSTPPTSHFNYASYEKFITMIYKQVRHK